MADSYSSMNLDGNVQLDDRDFLFDGFQNEKLWLHYLLVFE